MALYPQQDWTMESLKRKFQEMARAKIKTGDPNMLPHIRSAKRAYYAIVKKTDSSTGVNPMIPFSKQGKTTATLMRRKVKMERNGVCVCVLVLRL